MSYFPQVIIFQTIFSPFVFFGAPPLLVFQPIFCPHLKTFVTSSCATFSWVSNAFENKSKKRLRACVKRRVYNKIGFVRESKQFFEDQVSWAQLVK